MKTLKELNEKVWYRALIVIYLLLFSFFLFYAFSDTGFEGLFVVSIIFWVIRGAFYYISIGEFDPKE